MCPSALVQPDGVFGLLWLTCMIDVLEVLYFYISGVHPY